MSNAAQQPDLCVAASIASPWMPRPALGAVGGLLIGLVVLCAMMLTTERVAAFTLASLTHGAIYLIGVVLVVRGQARPRDLLLIVAVAVVLRAIAMTVPPTLTTDAFRYVWDGRIQWHGWNPYLHVPADERLAHLRDAVIYPNVYLKEIAVTIYPPVAEMIFFIANGIYDGLIGIKLVMAAFEAAVVWALVRWLTLAGLPRERVLIYAWHPMPIWEFSSMGHIDAAATGLLMLGLLAAVQRRQGLAGTLLAMAALTKYFPLAVLPAIWRRWDWRMPLAFAVTAVVLYLPYAVGAGPKVLGFLATHLDNEGYSAGYGFHVIWLLRDFGIADPPGKAWIIAALAILGGIAFYTFVARRRDEIKPEHLVLIAASFVWLTSPHYAWYFGWIVPLLAIHLTPAAMAMTLLCLLLNYPFPATSWTSPLYLAVFGAPLLVAIGHGIWQRQIRRRLALLTP